MQTEQGDFPKTACQEFREALVGPTTYLWAASGQASPGDSLHVSLSVVSSVYVTVVYEARVFHTLNGCGTLHL